LDYYVKKKDLGEKYNINYTLDEIDNKNNIICNMTKKTPNEVFFDELINEKE